MHEQRCAQRPDHATGTNWEHRSDDEMGAHRDSVQSAQALRTESSDQLARRLRYARAAHRHRNDERHDHHQWAKPRKERTDRTGQRAPRTDERQRGQPPERVDREGSVSDPLLRHSDLFGSARHIGATRCVLEPDSSPGLSPRPGCLAGARRGSGNLMTRSLSACASLDFDRQYSGDL